MKWLDLSHNRRIPVLMELVNSMNRVSEPRELLEKFIGTMRRAYGLRCVAQLSTRGLGPGQYRIFRLLAQDGREVIHPPEPDDAESLPVRQGGILSQIVLRGEPAILHEMDLHQDPVLGEGFGSCKSAVAAPVFENELGINWVVLFSPEPNTFDADDLEEVILRSNLVASMVSNLETARKLIRASIHIQEEFEQIGRIQQALLPEKLPSIPGLALAASYSTFDRAGGDLYDVARLGSRMQNWQGEPDDRWMLLIGDVSGHGPAAAVVMAMFHAILHTYPVRPAGPAEVLTHVNRHLCAKRIEQSFVTAFLGFYDSKTRELAYASAGHNPPLLKDFPHRGAPYRLDAVGELPLGIFHDVQYKEARITLHPGQTLILYTDGITEAGRESGEMFGVEGIEQALITCTGAPDCAIRHIAEALARRQGDNRPADDQTIVAAQVV